MNIRFAFSKFIRACIHTWARCNGSIQATGQPANLAISRCDTQLAVLTLENDTQFPGESSHGLAMSCQRSRPKTPIQTELDRNGCAACSNLGVMVRSAGVKRRRRFHASISRHSVQSNVCLVLGSASSSMCQDVRMSACHVCTEKGTITNFDLSTCVLQICDPFVDH